MPRRDSGEEAEVSGAIGGLGRRGHAEQTRLEGERKQAGFDVAAGAGREQIGLPEPVHDSLDVAGLIEVAAHSAFESTSCAVSASNEPRYAPADAPQMPSLSVRTPRLVPWARSQRTAPLRSCT